MPVIDVAKGLVHDAVDAGTDFWTLQRVRHANPGTRVARGVRITGPADRLSLGAGAALFGPSSISLADGGGLSGSLLRIGAHTYVGEFANLRTAGAPITIGANCLLAQSVTIVGSNHGTAPDALIVDQPWTGSGVEIGDDVWLGAGVIVVPGARIGNGCVVAANSVVRGDVPAGSMVGGSPARPLRSRCPDPAASPS